MNMYITRKN
jgi:hypothetical protein